jgi:hypothetical protein
MQEIKLPHLAPVRFAKTVLQKDEKVARVSLEFPQLPTLSMMVEASAQSSAAFRVNDRESAYLVSLKGIKLLKKATKKQLEVEIVDAHRLDKMRYVEFSVFEDETILATGTLVIAVQ